MMEYFFSQERRKKRQGSAEELASYHPSSSMFCTALKQPWFHLWEATFHLQTELWWWRPPLDQSGQVPFRQLTW